MYGGYSVRIQLLLSVKYKRFYFRIAKRRHNRTIQPNGAFTKYAGSVIYTDANIIAKLRFAYQFKCCAIACGNMYTCAHGKYGYVARYTVKVCLCNKAAFLHVLLVPAHAYYIRRLFFCYSIAQPSNHAVYRIHTEQHNAAAECGIIEHMHMGIIESGQYHCPVHVALIVPGLALSIRIAAKEHYFDAICTDGLIGVHVAIHAGNSCVVP